MKKTTFSFSFKERGARYALSMLSDEQRKKGVVAASLGNHSQVKFPSILKLEFSKKIIL